jgi:hypothetical protein
MAMSTADRWVIGLGSTRFNQVEIKGHIRASKAASILVGNDCRLPLLPRAVRQVPRQLNSLSITTTNSLPLLRWSLRPTV